MDRRYQNYRTVYFFKDLIFGKHSIQKYYNQHYNDQ